MAIQSSLWGFKNNLQYKSLANASVAQHPHLTTLPNLLEILQHTIFQFQKLHFKDQKFWNNFNYIVGGCGGAEWDGMGILVVATNFYCWWSFLIKAKVLSISNFIRELFNNWAIKGNTNTFSIWKLCFITFLGERTSERTTERPKQVGDQR